MGDMLNNLRDLLGYVLDFMDVVVVRHRRYAYCSFVAGTFSDQETFVSSVFQRFYKEDDDAHDQG